ncbi:MAG TPA: Rrf2 family transcriptional regulator [Acidimicrobiales bacterium]|jgi:Rrf2 family protein
MQLGEGVEWALHSCVLLACVPGGRALPASRLAEYHGLPAAYLAKHLQQLSGARILESTKGRVGGYRLARPANEITLLDVVEAIEGSAPVFRCTEIRRRGPCAGTPGAYPTMCGVACAMERAEAAWRSELRSQTVADLVASTVMGAPQPVQVRSEEWLAEATR